MVGMPICSSVLRFTEYLFCLLVILSSEISQNEFLVDIVAYNIVKLRKTEEVASFVLLSMSFVRMWSFRMVNLFCSIPNRFCF